MVDQAVEAGSPESGSSEGGVLLTSPEIDSQGVTEDGSQPGVADRQNETGQPESESPEEGVFHMEGV